MMMKKSSSTSVMFVKKTNREKGSEQPQPRSKSSPKGAGLPMPVTIPTKGAQPPLLRVLLFTGVIVVLVTLAANLMSEAGCSSMRSRKAHEVVQRQSWSNPYPDFSSWLVKKGEPEETATNKKGIPCSCEIDVGREVIMPAGDKHVSVKVTEKNKNGTVTVLDFMAAAESTKDVSIDDLIPIALNTNTTKETHNYCRSCQKYFCKDCCDKKYDVFMKKSGWFYIEKSTHMICKFCFVKAHLVTRRAYQAKKRTGEDVDTNKIYAAFHDDLRPHTFRKIFGTFDANNFQLEKETREEIRNIITVIKIRNMDCNNLLNFDTLYDEYIEEIQRRSKTTPSVLRQFVFENLDEVLREWATIDGCWPY